MTPQDPKTRAKELADAHWEYVEGILKTHDISGTFIKVAKHHYLTAAVHFHGHGVEDERNRLFYPRIGSPLTPEEIADINAITPSGCQNKECKHWDLPAPCNCTLHGTAATTCKLYAEPGELPPDLTPIAIPGPLDFSLPSITLECTADEAWAKYEEEWRERDRELVFSFHYIVETWDCLQALQTHKERGGAKPLAAEGIISSLNRMVCSGKPVMVAKAACLMKNAQRGYYAPKVNAAILASNGHSWTVKGE